MVDLQQRYDSTSISVVQELLEHPDFSSERIAERLGLSREELLECYDIIRSNKELQHIIIENSKSPRLTKTTSDLITAHKYYLVRILSGEEIYPLILEFHPGPVCQCQCKFCFSTGYDYGEYTKAEKPISRNRVLEIFDECRQNGVEQIWFSGGKEPLTNPLTPQYLRSANEMGFKTRLYTNGISMNKHVQEIILDCQHIRIGINGVKPPTYNRIHFPQKSRRQISGVFDRILANMCSLVSLKRENGKSVKIGIGLILQPGNYDEMVDFADLGCRLGVDSVHFRLETIGMVRDFTSYERDTIRSQITELTRRNYGIELDIRGGSGGRV
ncbi:radical SAM protein [Chloroflexota bacterium]